ncbi:28S ribosomal protein S15, mitochondrial [Orussus abietinus]|uniref:28S ribosomal protein S15, mitochondrial n=1 Tax=Orussus abietinus TaxID=222816 RepID=UPI000626CA76|nr:28S ribosomal protein S15, mitochondrial [Orussus abietinus]
MNVLSKGKCVSRIIDSYLKNGSHVTRGFKSELKIKWVRPEKIPSIRPEKSGDLGLDIKLDRNDYNETYSQSKEFKEADEVVKNMFSLKFFPQREVRSLERRKFVDGIRQHYLDTTSYESRIASMTCEILQLQEQMVENDRNGKTREFLKELIDKRKRILKCLRMADYKRFEWLLEKLNIVYHPFPERYSRPCRKDSLRKLTAKHCDEVKQKKLDSYKAELNAQKKDFYKEKAEKLAFIRNEEQSLGLPITVTEEDIEHARKLAAEAQ